MNKSPSSLPARPDVAAPASGGSGLMSVDQAHAAYCKASAAYMASGSLADERRKKSARKEYDEALHRAVGFVDVRTETGPGGELHLSQAVRVF